MLTQHEVSLYSSDNRRWDSAPLMPRAIHAIFAIFLHDHRVMCTAQRIFPVRMARKLDTRQCRRMQRFHLAQRFDDHFTGVQPRTRPCTSSLSTPSYKEYRPRNSPRVRVLSAGIAILACAHAVGVGGVV